MRRVIRWMWNRGRGIVDVESWMCLRIIRGFMIVFIVVMVVADEEVVAVYFHVVFFVVILM